MPGIFDVKKLAAENSLRDEIPYEIKIPKEYGQERQNPWENAIAGRLVDAISTGHFLNKTVLGESNPTLNWMGRDPKKIVPGLIATDLAAVPILKMIERKKPKLANALLKGLGGFGTYRGMLNYKHEKGNENIRNEEYLSRQNRSKQLRSNK